ncbi:hypothetical protein SLEP1_g59250, partial [Rubroshorea leprosula]
MDDQDNTQLSGLGLSDFQSMSRNLFVEGSEGEQMSGLNDERTPTGGEQPVEIATHNSSALSNVVVLTKPRGSGKSNPEPSSSKHNEELMRKNANLERQLKTYKIEPYHEGFKIPHLETYDGSGDPDEHLHTYHAIMKVQNATNAMMCKVFPATLKSNTRSRGHLLLSMTPPEQTRVNIVITIVNQMLGIPVEFAIHKLSTDPTKKLVVQKCYLFGPEKQDVTDEQIHKLLQADFIRRVEYSQWVSNFVLIKKPNSKWRMCIDFTNLNEACLKDPHPLPNVEKLVECAAGHECMSFLYASLGYHQVQLRLDDQEKTTFYAGDAIYYYVMIPFRLKNAGATYQKLVQVVFKLQIGRNIEVYVDDMIVTNLRAEDHIDNLNEIFQNLRQAWRKLNPLKCMFVVESCKFMGYVVSKKGTDKVQAVQQMKPPKIVKDVQRLTSRLVALHRFIAKSTERCLPFFKALREPKNFQWTNKCQQAFNELKQYLASLPLLSKPVEGEKLYLYLGITDEAINSILLKELKIGFVSFQIDKIPMADNKQADELSKLSSSQDINSQRTTFIEILDAPSYDDLIPECQVLSTDPSSPSWTTPLINYFQSGKLPENTFEARLVRRKVAHFNLIDVLKSFCDDYDIELSLTFVYTPQSNGQAESANKIVLRGLNARVLATHSNWVDELNKVLWSCRTMPSLTTGETPFSLAYKVEVVIPMEIDLLTTRPAQ